MNDIALLAWQNIKTVFKDRTAAIWMVAMPLVYIFVFGSAFRSGQDPAAVKAQLVVVNQDQGVLSRRFLHHLRSESILLDTMATYPQYNARRVLTIPDSFSRCLAGSRVLTLPLQLRSGGDMDAGAMVELSVQKAAYRLLADLTEIDIHGQSADTASFALLDKRQKLLRVETSYAGRARVIPRGFSQQVPANMVMFTMLALFIYAGTTLVEERNNGMLRRLKIAPLSFYHIFFGRVLGVCGIGVLQIGIIMAMGRFIFSVQFGSYPLALTTLVLLFSATVAGMGIMLGLLIRNEEKLIAVAIVLTLSMAALSGCWFPLEITPRWFEFSANFLPSGLALKAFNRLISYGLGWQAIWPFLLGLAGFLALFTAIAARGMRRSVE